jgi:hypothetical protein
MKKTNFLLALVLLLAACGPAGQRGQAISGCGSTLSSLSDLLAGNIPSHFESENPVKQGGEIDVMDYFNVLDRLSMRPGYILDYVYHFDGMGGYPILYVRPQDQPAYASEADLPEDTGESYLDYVETDDTAEGYFQYALLSMFARQFYLFWHSNYNDTQVVCDRGDVSQIISGNSFGLAMPLTVKLRALLLHNLAPRVTLNDDTAEVQLITFTKWGGFYLTTFTIRRALPHSILDVQDKNLIHYDCGIMF